MCESEDLDRFSISARCHAFLHPIALRRPDFLIADMTMLLFHESSTQYIRKRFDSGVHEWKQIGYVDGLALWAKSFREIHHNL